MKNAVTLRKMGGFYTCFDNDALVLGFLCDYKIKNDRVGFPIITLNKVINILEENTVNYIVRENMEEKCKKTYKSNKYNFYLEKGKKKNNFDEKINYIMNKLCNLTEEELENLLEIIEEHV